MDKRKALRLYIVMRITHNNLSFFCLDFEKQIWCHHPIISLPHISHPLPPEPVPHHPPNRHSTQSSFSRAEGHQHGRFGQEGAAGSWRGQIHCGIGATFDGCAPSRSVFPFSPNHFLDVLGQCHAVLMNKEWNRKVKYSTLRKVSSSGCTRLPGSQRRDHQCALVLDFDLWE